MASHASAAALGVLVAVGVGLAAREATSTEPPSAAPALQAVHRLDSRALAGFGGLMSVAPSPTFGAGWDLGPDTWTISRDGRALTRWHGMDRETFIGREPPGW